MSAILPPPSQRTRDLINSRAASNPNGFPSFSTNQNFQKPNSSSLDNSASLKAVVDSNKNSQANFAKLTQ